MQKSFYRVLASLALPIAFQNIVSSSLTLLDNLMVSSLSETALASVGLATQLFGTHWMITFGFCTGCGTFYTQFWGLRDSKSIKKVMGIALMTCFLAGVPFFVLGRFFPIKVLGLFTDDPVAAAYGAEYLRTASVNFLLVAVIQVLSSALRSTQQTRIPMYASITSFICDVIFNYLLIFGNFGFPRMELAGAALATVIARCVELSILLISLYGRKNILAGRPSEYFSFNRSFAGRVYRNSAATTLNEGMWGLAIAAQNACYGHLSTVAYAAWQAGVTIMDMFQSCCFSLGDADLILVGERIGRGDTDGAKDVSKKLLRVSLVISSLIAVLLIFASGPLIGIFKLSAEGAFYAKRLIIIRAVTLPLNLYNCIQVTGNLRAGGDARFAALSETCTMWLCAVPITALGCLIWKLPIYWVVVLAQAEAIIKAVILDRRYRSGKWLKNMIEGM